MDQKKQQLAELVLELPMDEMRKIDLLMRVNTATQQNDLDSVSRDITQYADDLDQLADLFDKEDERTLDTIDQEIDQISQSATTLAV